MNGPWEGDHKGDIAFEDKLTLSLLARRMYDPFSGEIGSALTRFDQAAIKAQLAFDLSHHLSDGSRTTHTVIVRVFCIIVRSSQR